MSSQLFNAQGQPGAAHVVLETTAGEARADAPNATTAEQVEKNVDATHTAAEHAAMVAKVKGSELTGEPVPVSEQIQAAFSAVATDAAVQGQKDVEDAKAKGSAYIEQAKALASSALSTAQAYLPAGMGGQTISPDLSPHTKPSSHASGIEGVTTSLQSGIEYAVEAAKQYMDAAQETMQSQVERAKGAAEGLMGTAGVQLSVPASSAPLESGLQKLENTIYPPGRASDIVANEPKAP